MMKKGLSIFTFMLVNIILLASILIPHHHHEDEVCFLDMHSFADCDSHDHSNTSHNHDAEDPVDHQNCLLDQEIVLPSNQVDLENENFIYIDKQSDFEGFYAVIPDPEPPEQLSPNSLIAHAPLVLAHYSRFVIGSSGLRAPPSC